MRSLHRSHALPRSTKSNPDEAQSARQRLDQAMVTYGLIETRARARDLIVRGLVLVDNAVVAKPAHLVDAKNSLSIARAGPAHVSRGADKLVSGLAAFGFDPRNLVVLDVGASTGGFTDVLLRAEAQKVYAVDVGRGQLHSRLAADVRVVSLEATDARTITPDMIRDTIDAVVCDVSFISLIKALPAALDMARSGAWLIALIKPQFEAGRGHVGKGGIVREEAVHTRVVEDVKRWLTNKAWTVHGVVPSPITGGDGNREFLIGATKP